MTFRRNFQRNTSTTGRVVDTGPTTRTNTGLTGLGAVGGPRGVGAGALRVLVEFLTTYDAEALGQLEADLQAIDKTEAGLNRTRQQAVRQRAAAQGVITRIGNLEASLTRGQNKLLKESIDLEKRRQQQLARAKVAAPGSPERADARGQATDAANQLRRNMEALARSTGLSRRELTLLLHAERNILNAKRQQASANAAIRAGDQALVGIARQRLAAESQLANLRNRAGVAVGKIGSLALGAIGGLVGGAVVGAGFAAVQVVLDAIGSGLQDIVDPANDAREAIAGVSDEIQGLAKSGDQNLFEAARDLLRELGPLAQGLNADVLAQASAIEIVNQRLEKYNELLDIQTNAERLRQEAINKRIEQLRDESDVLQGQTGVGSQIGFKFPWEQRPALGDAVAEEQRIIAQAIKEVDAAANQAAASVNRAAQAEQYLARAGDHAAVAQRGLAAALQAAGNAQISGLQSQMENIPTVSPRTTGIQNQLDAISEASQAAQVQQQLADIDMQSGNILLEQRLSLLNSTVNLEQYAGQARLTAIQHNISMLQRATFAEEAQISAIDGQIKALQRYNREMERRERNTLKAIDKQIRALQKEQEEIDKTNEAAIEGYDKRIKALQDQIDAIDEVNKLLDLQYKASQTLQRNQGESIGDFLGRRAQANREILAEFTKLRLRNQIEEIQGEKEKAQAGIEAERDRRQAVIERLQAQKEALQEQFEIAREEREMKVEALQNERERLQAILERHQKARQAAIQALQEEAQRTQREIQLRELAERRKQVLAEEAKRKRIAALQAELRASQEMDAAAVKSRREALQRQIEAVQRGMERVQFYTNQANLTQLRNAVSFANTMEKLSAISGGIAGARMAKAQLEAMMAGGQIAPAAALPFLRQLNAIINTYFAQKASLYESMLNNPIRSGPVPMAEGGVFGLTNAMNNPFGANIRTGESGPEIGVVLSNKVVQALRESEGKQIGDQTFIINRSDDPWRDKQRFGRVVKEAVKSVFD